MQGAHAERGHGRDSEATASTQQDRKQDEDPWSARSAPRPPVRSRIGFYAEANALRFDAARHVAALISETLQVQVRGARFLVLGHATDRCWLDSIRDRDGNVLFALAGYFPVPSLPVLPAGHSLLAEWGQLDPSQPDTLIGTVLTLLNGGVVLEPLAPELCQSGDVPDQLLCLNLDRSGLAEPGATLGPSGPEMPLTPWPAGGSRSPASPLTFLHAGMDAERIVDAVASGVRLYLVPGMSPWRHLANHETRAVQQACDLLHPDLSREPPF